MKMSEETEKHYYDYTSEDFIKVGIAKECTTCPDFAKKNALKMRKCKTQDTYNTCFIRYIKEQILSMPIVKFQMQCLTLLKLSYQCKM